MIDNLILYLYDFQQMSSSSTSFHFLPPMHKLVVDLLRAGYVLIVEIELYREGDEKTAKNTYDIENIRQTYSWLFIFFGHISLFKWKWGNMVYFLAGVVEEESWDHFEIFHRNFKPRYIGKRGEIESRRGKKGSTSTSTLTNRIKSLCDWIIGNFLTSASFHLSSGVVSLKWGYMWESILSLVEAGKWEKKFHAQHSHFRIA